MTDIQDVTPALSGSNTGGIWPTMTVRKVRHTVEACHRFGHIGLITGPSGTGKTTAASVATTLADAEDEADTHFVTMTAAAGERPVSALACIAAEVGAYIRPQHGLTELYDGIVKRGWSRKSLLVIDEAQFLPDGALHMLRNLWDALDNAGRAPGLVLVGTPELADRIEGRSGRKPRELDALRGRLGAVVRLAPPTAEDIAAIMQHLGIVGERAAALVDRISRGRGGLHNLRRIEKMARELAGRGAPMTLGHIQTAAEIAGVGA